MINKKTLFEASKRLGASGLRLYLYFASNADRFSFYPSPTAIERDYGMKDGQYYSAWKILVENGCLVQTDPNINNYVFIERPEKWDVENQEENYPENEEERPENQEERPENAGRNNINKINNIVIDSTFVSSETKVTYSLSRKKELINYYSNRDKETKERIEISIKKTLLKPDEEIPFVTDGFYYCDIDKGGVNLTDDKVIERIADINEICNKDALQYARANGLIE